MATVYSVLTVSNPFFFVEGSTYTWQVQKLSSPPTLQAMVTNIDGNEITIAYDDSLLPVGVVEFTDCHLFDPVLMLESCCDKTFYDFADATILLDLTVGIPITVPLGDNIIRIGDPNEPDQIWEYVGEGDPQDIANWYRIEILESLANNWGDQVVVSDSTLTGDGTPGLPLSAVQQVGDGVTVTGDGTPGDPFVSDAFGPTQTGLLDARDTANRDRANHTGTQAISTITGLQAELDIDATIVVADRTALKAVDTGVGAALLLEEGRRGLFYWDSTVLIATHQADTYEAFNVPPSAIADGAWVRHADPEDRRASWYGFLPSAASGENTDRLNEAVQAGPGKITIDSGTYTFGAPILGPDPSINPGQDTELYFEPGVTFQADVAGFDSLLLLSNSSVRVFGNGVLLDGNNCDESPVRAVFGSSNCILDDVEIDGGGAAALTDALLVEDSVNLKVLNSVIRDGVRNSILLQSSRGGTFENCSISGAQAGSGVALKANGYDAFGATGRCYDNTIRKCSIIGNSDDGIFAQFCDTVKIEDCVIHSNGESGISANNTGDQFDASIYRDGDLVGVGAFSALDGWITISPGGVGNLISQDWGITRGTNIQLIAVGGATMPTEVSSNSGRRVVADIDATQTQVRLATVLGLDDYTTLTGSGSGTLDTDPAISQITGKVNRVGQSSNIYISRNEIYANGGTEEVDIDNAVNVVIEKNNIGRTITLGGGISVAYSQNIALTENTIKSVNADTVGIGIDLVYPSYTSMRGNYVEWFITHGIKINASYPTGYQNTVVSCGTTGAGAVHFERGYAAHFSGNFVQNDAFAAAGAGFIISLTFTNSHFSSCNAQGSGAGSPVASGFSGTGILNIFESCRLRDGTTK